MIEKDPRECQNVECTNVGKKVTVRLDMEDGTKRVEEIFFCQILVFHQMIKSYVFTLDQAHIEMKN